MSLIPTKIPATDTLIFECDQIDTAEGYFKIYLYRNYSAYDLANFGLSAKPYTLLGLAQQAGMQVGTISNGLPLLGMGYANSTVHLRNELVTTIPVVEEDAENYFGEPVIHDSELGLFNTNSIADITGLNLTGPIKSGKVSFGTNAYGRLLKKYLLPDSSPITYFPIPQIVAQGTSGVYGTASGLPTFSDASFSFLPTHIGYQILIGAVSSTVTSPAGIFTIVAVVSGTAILSNRVDAGGGSGTNAVWGLVQPPFSLVNHNTSIYGNYGTGSGSKYTDTTSYGGNPFAQLESINFSITPVLILIDFVPYLITGCDPNGQWVTVASYYGGPSTPPSSPSYWQVIFQQTDFFSTPLYCQVTFQQKGSSNVTLWFSGKMQPATEGDDLRWYTGSNEPLLDDNTNPPSDAEQIFTLKFTHSVISGLGLLPVTPTTLLNDTSGTWYVPSALSGSQMLPIHPVTDFLPATSLLVWDTADGAPSVLMSCPIWAGHIDWNYLLNLAMIEAFGSGNYIISSDDSPIQIEGARYFVSTGTPATGKLFHNDVGQLTGQQEFIPGNWTSSPTTNDGSPLIQKGLAAPTNLTGTRAPNTNWKINFANPGSYYIPQTLLGIQSQPQLSSDGAPGSAYVVPRSTCWPDYMLSFWDVIVEVSLCNGFIPILKANSDGTVTLHFQDRTKVTGNIFSGMSPVTAKPNIMLEGEVGIEVSGLQTFLNPRTTDGWYDDLYAMKRGHGLKSVLGPYDIEEHYDDSGGHDDLDDTVNPRQSNPYSVPSTPQTPAKLQVLMRYAGYTFLWAPTNAYGGAAFPSYSQVLGIGCLQTFDGNSPYIPTGGTGNLSFGAFWPTLVPLIPANPQGNFLHNPGPLLSGKYNPTPILHDVTPVIRSRFTYKDIIGNTITTLNDSLRQTLARFYSLIFVNSQTKYEVEDLTLTQFWLLDANGNRTGNPSWENVALFNERRFPDGNLYWLKSIKRDPNTMTTSTTYLRMQPNQFIGVGGNFFDANEQPGSLSPGTPPNTDGPTPTNQTP